MEGRDRGRGASHTVELTTPGVCLARAFAEQLSAHGDVHGLIFGVKHKTSFDRSWCERVLSALMHAKRLSNGDGHELSDVRVCSGLYN